MHGDQTLFFHIFFSALLENGALLQRQTALAKTLNDCVYRLLPVPCLCHALFSWPGLLALKHFALNLIYLMLLLNL